MAYLFQLNIYLVLVYGFYWLVLKNETFHHQNRMILLGGICLAILIPLMPESVSFDIFTKTNTNKGVQILIEPIKAVSVVLCTPSQLGLNWQSSLLLMYVFGIIFMFIRLIINVLNLKKLLLRNIELRAFSFGRKVFVDSSLPQYETILQHEVVHARQLHTFDILLIEVLLIFNWFNPVLFLMKKAFKNLHEFLADEIASQQLGKAKYARLLLSEQFGVPEQVFISSFFETSTLKQRIQMLAKKKSTKNALLKYGLSLPLFVVMVVVSSSFVNKNVQKSPIVTQLNGIVNEVADLGSQTAAIKPEPETKNTKMMAAILTSKEKNLVFAQADTTEKPKETGIRVIGKDGKVLTEQPIFIVDGVELNADQQNRLAPENIESMTVLKKENATSVYGERAKNGVVIITTKSKKGILDFSPLPASSSAASTQEEVFAVVEESAEFPGGTAGLMQYLSANIKYPEAARNARVEGKVFAELILGKDGSIKNVKIIKGIGFGCDEETIRVIQAMPNWKPGRQNKLPVSMSYVLPIEFLLKK